MSNVTTTQNNGLEVLGMRITSLQEAMNLADFFAKSDLVPKDYKGKPGNIVVAWQKGHEVGLMPQQSLETIAVINGRACIWGDGLIALVKNSNKEEWTNEWIEGTGDNMVAYCETKRERQPKTIKRSFSVAEAKTAGLWGRNTWANYPKRMLQMRARGFCFRDAYPDVLNGLQLAEEQLDASHFAQNTINLEEVEPALKQLGLTLEKNNGVAVVQGNCFPHAKMLKELGFEYKDKQWSAFYDDTVTDTEIVSDEEQPQAKENKEAQPTEDNPLAQYGLSITEKTVKGKIYQIVEGKTLGLDKVLTEHGFTKGKTGKWGKEKGLF